MTSTRAHDIAMIIAILSLLTAIMVVGQTEKNGYYVPDNQQSEERP